MSNASRTASIQSLKDGHEERPRAKKPDSVISDEFVKCYLVNGEMHELRLPYMLDPGFGSILFGEGSIANLTRSSKPKTPYILLR